MKKKNSLFFWFFLFILLTTYNFQYKNYENNNFFSIKKIELSGASNFERKEIEEAIDTFKGKNIIFISRRDIGNIIKKFEFVKEFKVKKIYPNKIAVSIKEYNPIGIFHDENKGKILLENGNLVYEDKIQGFINLPKVSGKNADKFFSKFYESLSIINFETKVVKEFKYFGSNRWDIILKDNKVIKLPSMNYKNSLKNFLQIYQKNEFKNFKVFDFRINGQLVLK